MAWVKQARPLFGLNEKLLNVTLEQAAYWTSISLESLHSQTFITSKPVI